MFKVFIIEIADYLFGFDVFYEFLGPICYKVTKSIKEAVLGKTEIANRVMIKHFCCI